MGVRDLMCKETATFRYSLNM